MRSQHHDGTEPYVLLTWLHARLSPASAPAALYMQYNVTQAVLC